MELDLDKVAVLSQSGFEQCLAFVCERGDTNQLHKMFLKMDIKNKFDSETLSIGLFSAIMQSQSDTAMKILDIADKMKITITNRDLQKCFNLLIKKGDSGTIEYLDEKFKFFKEQFNIEGDPYFVQDGKIYRTGGTGGPNDYEPNALESMIIKYSGHTVGKSLDNENHFSFILNLGYDLTPSYIEESFIATCDKKNINVINVFLTHEKTKEIVKNSDYIKSYMSESTENFDFKQTVKEMMASVELKEKLEATLKQKTSADSLISCYDHLPEGEFIRLCQDGYAMQLKKSKIELTPELFSVGLFTALNFERSSAVVALLGMAPEITQKELLPSINLLSTRGDTTMIDYLDEKFDFFKNHLSSDVELRDYAPPTFLSTVPMNNDSSITDITRHYNIDILSFNLDNPQLIAEIINKPYRLSDNLVESAFLNACEHNYPSAAHVMLNHLKTESVIKNSAYVNDALNTYPESFATNIKILTSTALNNKLEGELEEKSQPKKMKI